MRGGRQRRGEKNFFILRCYCYSLLVVIVTRYALLALDL
jgi:hypothetical protein